VICHPKHYFIDYHSDSTHDCFEVEIIDMLEFLFGNIDAIAGGQVFQFVGLPMVTNCAPLLADLFLCTRGNSGNLG
jgi:hypothetical protein